MKKINFILAMLLSIFSVNAQVQVYPGPNTISALAPENAECFRKGEDAIMQKALKYLQEKLQRPTGIK